MQSIHGHGLWAVLRSKIMIGGWKISLDWGLLLCAPSYHVCSLVPGDIEDSTRQSTTMEAQNKHYTTYWMLQFMWDCGYRIYADQWVKRLFEINSKWLGKRGTNNTKTGMEIKRTLLQCSNTLETEGHRSGRQTLEIRVFHSYVFLCQWFYRVQMSCWK